MKQFLLLCLITLSLNLSAENLSSPSGKVILTLSGNILNTQDGNQAQFDLEQLQQLSSNTFTLQTRWDDEVHAYHGPLLSAILEKVGSKGTLLRLTALNDYTIEIQKSFVDKYQPILAWQNDGKKMSIRNKGPLWLIIPHDKYPELNAEIHTGKMIWQLEHIEIE